MTHSFYSLVGLERRKIWPGEDEVIVKLDIITNIELEFRSSLSLSL